MAQSHVQYAPTHYVLAPISNTVYDRPCNFQTQFNLHHLL